MFQSRAQVDREVLSLEELEAFKFKDSNFNEILDAWGNKEKTISFFGFKEEFKCSVEEFRGIEWCELKKPGLVVNFMAGEIFNLLEITSDEYPITYKDKAIAIGMPVGTLSNLFPKAYEKRESRVVPVGLAKEERLDMVIFWVGVAGSDTTVAFQFDHITQLITEISLFVYN